MFHSYCQLILNVYKRKLEANLLPSCFIKPSPAKIKAACLKICQDRFKRKDGKILSEFFGTATSQAECAKAISSIDIDKFRPLIKYIQGETTSTDEKNIELLAWMIDFEPRPFEFGRKYEEPMDQKESPAPDAQQLTDQAEIDGLAILSPTSFKLTRQLLIPGVVLVAVLGRKPVSIYSLR